ncbi:MAG TPA: radical SAM protein [Blastocatellia bacterium]|jgi:uncharacterized protein
MSEAFSQSRFLRFIPRSDGWAVYHSLFGNLSLIDDKGKKFIEAFSDSATIEQASRAMRGYPRSTLRSYANNLISQGYLVPSGCDDYSIIEEDQVLRKGHLHTGYLVRALQLVTINSCNYKCKYCFMDMQADERSDSREIGSAEPMSIEVAEASMQQTIDLLNSNGNDSLYIEFFGGEPLMNVPVIRHVLTKFGNYYDGVNIFYSITTNGALITREVAELFKTYNVTVTISIDIPVKVTGLPIVMAKSGDRIRDCLATLRDCGCVVTFNSVIAKETIRNIDGRKLIDFAKQYNVGVVGLILDLDLAFYRSAENREMALNILLDSHRYGRQVGVRVVGYWHQIFSQIIGQQPINLRSGYKTCPATGAKLSVEPDGSMFTCKCTSNGMGHVSNLHQILSSDTYADYAMRAYRHAPGCEGCEIEGFCSGVCMGSYENEFQKKDMIETGACDIFRRITRDLILDLPAEEMPRLKLEGYSIC